MIQRVSSYDHSKLLAPWKHGEELDHAVFRITATFPLQFVTYHSYPMLGDYLWAFDVNAFIQRLIEEMGIAHIWEPIQIRAPEGMRCFATEDVLQSKDPEITAKHNTRQLLWIIWERCSGSDLKDHPAALAGNFDDYLIENLDLVREVEASFRTDEFGPSMEVLQQLEQRALPKWIRERFLSDSLRMPNSRWGDCLPTSSRTPIQVGEVLQSKGRTSTSATLLKGSVRLKTGQLGCVLCGTLLLQAGPSTRAEPLLRAQNTCEQ